MSKIYINPGHGAGGDYGACYYGRREADDALKLCLLVRDRLKASGVETRMSREVTDGKGPTVEAIAEDANSWGADLVFALHRNASTDATAHGVEIYIHDTSNAERKANAQAILDGVVNAAGMKSRGVKQNRKWVMIKDVSAPSYYLEYGFISNTGDNAKFDATLGAAAEAIAKALCGIVGAAYQEDERPGAPSTGTYTVVKGDSPWGIASKLLGSGTKYKELMSYNGLAEDAAIYAGQVLKIPGALAPAAPTGYPEPTRNIANYTTGDDVGWVQTKLQALGYDPGDIDCKYGGKGEAAVRQLQRDYGLSVDGIVGANTRKALKGQIAKASNPYRKPTQVIYLGDWGDGIKWVQWHLQRKGYNIGASGIDGQYGAGTQAAVKQFQRNHGLSVDGIVGEKTRAALEA